MRGLFWTKAAQDRKRPGLSLSTWMSVSKREKTQSRNRLRLTKTTSFLVTANQELSPARTSYIATLILLSHTSTQKTKNSSMCLAKKIVTWRILFTNSMKSCWISKKYKNKDKEKWNKAKAKGKWKG